LGIGIGNWEYRIGNREKSKTENWKIENGIKKWNKKVNGFVVYVVSSSINYKYV